MNMFKKDKKVSRPSVFWFATEIGRAIAETGLSIPFRKLYNNCPNGDSHPVLVMPGFMATDKSTDILRDFLDNLGYTTYPWKLGRNYGKVEYLELLIARVEELYKAHGERVSLIGWSLGGVFARQVAKERPNMVRQLITLGSPFMGVQQANNAAWVYNLFINRDKFEDTNPDLLEELPTPAPVPTTAIYSKEDGVVPWELCIEPEEDYYHQNIQVRGSHLGLGVNVSVLKIIADRLQYVEANWEPFSPNNFVEDLLYYPSL